VPITVVDAAPLSSASAVTLVAVALALSPTVPGLVAVTGDCDGHYVVMRRHLRNGDPDAAFAAAASVLEGEIEVQRSTTTPIEARGYLARWDQFGESVTLTATTQNPHPERSLLANALGVPEEHVRVIAPSLGGAFGAKMRGQPEAFVVALLARLTGAPVKWVEERSESFLQGARQQHQSYEVAFDREGVIGAIRVDAVADVGVVGASPGWGMSFLTALTFPTGYRVQDVDIRMTAVATNKPPWMEARGFGKEASNLVMERRA
jgi:aerobic carbon-monoxide dehydrogenase large subunit